VQQREGLTAKQHAVGINEGVGIDQRAGPHRGAIQAAERWNPGDSYLLASENSIELATLRNLVMEGWRGKAPYPYLPVWFVFFVAWCLEILGKLTGKPPIATRKNIASTVWDREFSIAKAKKELGYSPKVSFREGIIETVNWYNRM
jgi:nucleoside-diphosphate-sugar epimerase